MLEIYIASINSFETIAIIKLAESKVLIELENWKFWNLWQSPVILNYIVILSALLTAINAEDKQ